MCLCGTPLWDSMIIIDARAGMEHPKGTSTHMVMPLGFGMRICRGMLCASYFLFRYLEPLGCLMPISC